MNNGHSSGFHLHPDFAGKHKFGAGLIASPLCPNCSIPFPISLVMSHLDPSANIECDMPIIYCMRCELCWEDFYYRYSRSGIISLDQFRKGDTYEMEWDDMPRASSAVCLKLSPFSPIAASYLDSLKSGDGLSSTQIRHLCHEVGIRERDSIFGLNQFGGDPWCWQNLDRPHCQRCRDQMVKILTLTNGIDPVIKICPNAWMAQLTVYSCIACRAICVRHSA
jgi:hypothetical protein